MEARQGFHRERSIFERARDHDLDHEDHQVHVERQNAGIWQMYLGMEMKSKFAWTKYAIREASQQESRRARSIFVRALRVEHQSTGIWRKFPEMETMTLRMRPSSLRLPPRCSQTWVQGMLPSSLRLPSRCSRTWVQGATPQRRTLPCFGPLAAGEAWRDGGCKALSTRLGT